MKLSFLCILEFFLNFRTLSAVYEVVGDQAQAHDKSKAEELFKKLDENSDGEISQG